MVGLSWGRLSCEGCCYLNLYELKWGNTSVSYHYSSYCYPFLLCWNRRNLLVLLLRARSAWWIGSSSSTKLSNIGRAIQRTSSLSECEGWEMRRRRRAYESCGYWCANSMVMLFRLIVAKRWQSMHHLLPSSELCHWIPFALLADLSVDELLVHFHVVLGRRERGMFGKWDPHRLRKVLVISLQQLKLAGQSHRS